MWFEVAYPSNCLKSHCTFFLEPAEARLSLYMQFEEASDIVQDALYELYFLFPCYAILIFYLFQALGTGFSQFAEPVFRRCINIIQTQQFAKVLATLIYLIFKIYLLSSSLFWLFSSSHVIIILIHCCCFSMVSSSVFLLNPNVSMLHLLLPQPN